MRTVEVVTMRRIVGRRKIVAATAAFAGAAALTFGVLPVSSASAAANGMQVAYCPPPDAVSVMVQGINQNRQYSQWTDRVAAPGECYDYTLLEHTTTDWWWQGTVVISYTHPGNDQFVFYQTCEVPNWDIGNIWEC
jgi:hypothetical protein